MATLTLVVLGAREEDVEVFAGAARGNLGDFSLEGFEAFDLLFLHHGDDEFPGMVCLKTSVITIVDK